MGRIGGRDPSSHTYITRPKACQTAISVALMAGDDDKDDHIWTSTMSSRSTAAQKHRLGLTAARHAHYPTASRGERDGDASVREPGMHLPRHAGSIACRYRGDYGSRTLPLHCGHVIVLRLIALMLVLRCGCRVYIVRLKPLTHPGRPDTSMYISRSAQQCPIT